jgi:fructokinase
VSNAQTPADTASVSPAGRSRAKPLAQSAAARIGVDFGGTKIEVAALDEKGRVIQRERTPNPGAYDAAVATVRDMVTRVERDLGARASVGVGVPGSISPRTGAMRNANSLWLNGRDFGGDLGRALDRPIRLANDANCLALSEVVDGAAKGAKVAVAVILGTGVGGGVVIDGRLIEGANGVGGEFGHMPLPWPQPDESPGPKCWCGKHGCLEVWVSGTGFQNDFATATGKAFIAEEIVRHAERGEREAIAALDRYLDRLGRGMAAVCNILDPDVFVLGGGMSNVRALYARLPDVIRKYIFSDVWEGAIVQPVWGDSSGVRGAARLWPDGAG